MKHLVGIIGLGMIGEKMMAEFIAHSGFEVASCWDLNPKICNQIQADYPAAAIANNAEEILSDRDIELVYIATPPVTHTDYGLKVSEQKKALLMEKPLSLKLADGEKLVKSTEDREILTAVNFGYGAGPVVDTLEDIIAENGIGDILGIEIRYEFPSWPLPNQLSAANWITHRNTGGMVREMFSHHVYLIHRLLGLLNVSTVELFYPEEEGAAESFILASLRVNDIPVRFMGGVGGPRAPRNSDFTLHGETGSLRITEGQQLLISQDGMWEEYTLQDTRSAVEARLDQLADLLEGKDAKLPTLRDAYEVQKVIESMLASK